MNESAIDERILILGLEVDGAIKGMYDNLR